MKIDIDIENIEILDLIPRSMWEGRQLADSTSFSIQTEDGQQVLREGYDRQEYIRADWIMRLTGSDFLCTIGKTAFWYHLDPYHLSPGKKCLVEFTFTPPLTLGDALRAMEQANTDEYQGMIRHRIKKLPESDSYVAYYLGIDQVYQGDVLIEGVDMFIELDDHFHKRFLEVYGDLIGQSDPWFG